MKEFKLDQEPKIKTGFIHPESYFDNVESYILQKISKQETPVRSLFSNKRWSIAAAAILLISLSISLVHLISKDSDAITDDQLENYIAEQTNITEDDIVDLLDDEKIHKIKLDLELDVDEVEEILLTENNVEEYLIN